MVIDHTAHDESGVAGRALTSPYSLDEQEHAYTLSILAGMPHEDALYQLGLPKNSDIAKRASVQAALEYLRQKQKEFSNITRVQLTEMFMQAFHCAATAGEMVQATREIGLLNDLYPAKKSIGVSAKGELNEEKAGRMKKIANMTDEELLGVIDMDLMPAPDTEIYEGEFHTMDSPDDSE